MKRQYKYLMNSFMVMCKINSFIFHMFIKVGFNNYVDCFVVLFMGLFNYCEYNFKINCYGYEKVVFFLWVETKRADNSSDGDEWWLWTSRTKRENKCVVSLGKFVGKGLRRPVIAIARWSMIKHLLTTVWAVQTSHS